MRRCVQVVLDAPRYARALLALRGVRRHWHNLEAVIIETEPATWDETRRQEVLQLLVKMDACIARVDGMLTQQPVNVKMSDSPRCSTQPNDQANQLQALQSLCPHHLTFPYRSQRWCRSHGTSRRSACRLHWRVRPHLSRSQPSMITPMNSGSGVVEVPD